MGVLPLMIRSCECEKASCALRVRNVVRREIIACHGKSNECTA